MTQGSEAFRAPAGAVGAEPLRMSGVGRWLRFGGFSVLDQGLYAGTSFVASILLARWLSRDEFGAYTLGFAVLALVVTLQAAALTEPMGVFGTTTYAGRFRSYVRFLLCVQTALAVGTALVLAGFALVLDVAGQDAVGHALYGLAAAVPFVLLLWLARRAFYARLAPQWAALGGLLYAVLTLSGIVLLHSAGVLSPAAAFLVSGGAGLVVGVCLLALLAAQLPAESGDAWNVRGATADHVRYARWALAASLTIWISAYVQYFGLAWAGFGQVGAMRALDTILLPWHLYIAALASAALPAFAINLRGDDAGRRTFVRRATVVFLGQAVFVCIVLAVAGPALMSALYGPKYSSYSYLLPLYGTIVIPETIAAIMICVWRARVKTRLVFVYNVVFAAALVAAVVVASRWDVSGVVVARVIVSYGVLAVFLAIGLRRSREER